MHGEKTKSRGPRLVMAIGYILGVCLGSYFLLRQGLSWREKVLFGCAIVYLFRVLFTSFVLLRRGVGWPEAAQVAPFLFVIQAALGYMGSKSITPWRVADSVWLGLYLLGSWLNTMSELQRMRWKRDATHQGHLYTGGLFSLSMHINYFGDSLLFAGFALLTTSPWALAIPGLMITMFMFVHIPTLDRHLSAKYANEFDAWASRTKKFVPFIY